MLSLSSLLKLPKSSFSKLLIKILFARSKIKLESEDESKCQPEQIAVVNVIIPRLERELFLDCFPLFCCGVVRYCTSEVNVSATLLPKACTCWFSPLLVAMDKLEQTTVEKSCCWDNNARTDSNADTLACLLASFATLLGSMWEINSDRSCARKWTCAVEGLTWCDGADAIECNSDSVASRFSFVRALACNG